MKKVIISIILVVVLVAGGLVLGLTLNKKNTAPTATMQMDLNPSVEFVLNSDNEILSVNYLNNDAGYVFANISVEGRNINEVVKEFTKVAIDSGYVDLEAKNIGEAGTEINVKINSSNAEQAEGLKASVSLSINNTFDAKGIYGRAVASISAQTTALQEKYSEVAENLKIDVKDFEGKTEAEVLEIIKAQSEKIKGLSPEQIEKLAVEHWDQALKTVKNAMNTIEDAIEDLEENIETAFNNVLENDIVESVLTLMGIEDTPAELANKTAEQKIDVYIAKINQSSLQQTTKESVINILNNTKTSIANIREQIATKKAEFQTKKAEFESKYNAYVADLKEQCKTFIEDCKTAIETKINEFKASTEYVEYSARIEANLATIQVDIKAWREAADQPTA